ncbi:site-specific DNA-methyltransferase [Aurantimonas coralicida]|uniref:site-specific DNA-methyltransferase n=1 Tax=Aurantimonas coralicida TaxID=182270 RepID=UPI001E432E20|nr:site-specific DNA-methyltransferase [Aurantimonas coralicida]MCD1644525.1 site-specific DNA-methyltransferase [Aurantimonas coralicida]
MPTLEFKGKPFVYSHHLSVPFRELRIDAGKSLSGADGPNLDDNLIIHGDNLEALKALLPRYAGKVDVIYIDPPYNTGKDDWRYNDRVSSPLMEAWLGSIVNKEDMERHEKWLCMIWPRLQILKELLAPHGIVFVSIDDNEVHALKMLLAEIFGEDNWLGTLVWKNATDNNPSRVAIEHEYIHAFARDKDETATVWKAPHVDLKEVMLAKGAELIATFPGDDDLSAAYKAWHKGVKAQLGPLAGYDLIDRKGIYTASRSVHNPGKMGYVWELFNPKTNQDVPKPLMGYRFPEDTRDKLLAEDRIIFSDDPDQLIRLKTYLENYQEKMPSVVEIDGRRGSNELRQMSFGLPPLTFKNPKTYTLIEWLLSYVAKSDALVLDSFAGSGTTAHAVLALNKADGGTRRFVLVEAEAYADHLTAERVRRAIRGVAGASDTTIRDGLNGSFTYCVLGDEMDLERFFAGDGSAPAWDRLAEYVAYTATGATLKVGEEGPDGYAGVVGGIRLHLIYRPNQTWMRSNEAMLDMATAERIAKAANGQPVLVFAAGKFMAQKVLTSMALTFCQLPYSIHRILGDGYEGVAGVDEA